MEPSLAHRIDRVLERLPTESGAHVSILDLLQQVEATLGYVPLEAIPHLAQSVGVTDAQVAGVLSHYPDLHTEPRGRHVIRVCQGEACVANHVGRVLRAVCEELHTAVGTTTLDNRFTVEKVYCVGNCGVSPTVMIDEDVHGRVTPEEIPALLERYR